MQTDHLYLRGMSFGQVVNDQAGIATVLHRGPTSTSSNSREQFSPYCLGCSNGFLHGNWQELCLARITDNTKATLFAFSKWGLFPKWLR